MSYRIPFNRPFIAGKELFHIARAVTNGQISADGSYTKLCARFIEERFGVGRALLTPSCTHALEMAAILCDVGPGDEVVLPSFTFVSTAGAMVRAGAVPRFVDIRPDTLNIDESLVDEACTPRTKLLLPIHYAGVACEMDAILTIARDRGLRVVEDAAQGVNSFYKGRALGSLGSLGTYSFHETKNYICGEGGALCINDPELVERAEIIRDKGTNRQRFFRGEVDKYTWVDVGSSYVPSELSAAFLWGQLEHMEEIGERRRRIYDRYQVELEDLAKEGLVRTPSVPPGCQTNYHMFYLILPTEKLRGQLIDRLNEQGIHAVFHYVPLHSSPVGMRYGYKLGDLPHTEELSARLVRLPFYNGMTSLEQDEVIDKVRNFLTKHC